MRRSEGQTAEDMRKKRNPLRDRAERIAFSLLPLLFCLPCLLAVQCGTIKTNGAAPSVFVSILPQKYFVDKIGGDYVKVTVMVEPGASPHSYEPKPAQMIALSKAVAYFSIGLEFEKAWLPKFKRLAQGMRIVSTDSGIEKMPALYNDEHNEEHGVSGDHRGLDPHIWLSPALVKKQAITICEALRSLDPSHDSSYAANLRAFTGQISQIQDTIGRILRGDPVDSLRKMFLVFHPAWAYFAREFNLRQIAIEIDGKEPGPKQLETIFELAKRYSIRTIFVQPQFSQQSARVIARQMHATVAIADDLAYDWEKNLISMAHAIAGR